MAQICSKCSHINPAEASYCYFDGAILGDPRSNGGPINAGARPFPSQFVFPSGQTCRNFDQLAMACQQNWGNAVDLLCQGYLATFLGGLGRADLALAAQDAARFPDQDRGLDQLLAKLPSQVLEPPKVLVEPTNVNLGLTPVGTDRMFELHLANQGMRLLYGSVVSDCKWLTLGDAPGNAQKLFQFGNDANVHVHIRGQHLRAGNKPLEGRLIVESNGGTATVLVRAEVPIKPFTEGVLAGAVTPRQIAEKAKAAPKDAAILFENGAVARWFKTNGWTYPVQGPSASGLGAVQQFFEALGLATAPKVEVMEKTLSLRGNVGQPVQATIEVKTPEKRPVYAHATCDQPWLDVSRTILNGRIANIVVLVPGVPNRPGETLQANVKVTANGNQKFVVPVSLLVTGGGPYYPALTPTPTMRAVPALAVSATPAAEPVVYATPVPVGAESVLSGVPVVQGIPYVTAEPFDVTGAAWNTSAPVVPLEVGSRRFHRRSSGAAWVHLLPLGLLLLALVGVIVKDLLAPKGGEDEPDPNPRLAFFTDEENRFGLETIDPKNPENNAKKLTYDKLGRTNSTVVLIDGLPRFYGRGAGEWEKAADSGGKKAVWHFPSQKQSFIKVTQTIDIIAGEPVEIGENRYKRFLDTCLVRYRIENHDRGIRRVGLRVMLDTLIGVDESNDGVPFTIPGLPNLVDTLYDVRDPSPIPDFIYVLEKPDLKNPGIVGQLNLKLGGKVEAPNRVSLTHWPGVNDRWDIPVRPIFDLLTRRKDSAVVLYWNEQPLKPGETRNLGYSFGLGSVSNLSGRLGVTVGGVFTPGGELTVVALVSETEQELTIKLDKGLTLVGGDAKQQVRLAAPGQLHPVTWRVRSSTSGNFWIEVQSKTGVSQKKRITIKSSSLF